MPWTKSVSTGTWWKAVFPLNSRAEFVSYYRNLFKNCSKHIQDSVNEPKKARLLLEILEIVFGGKEAVRAKHPFSYLLCPMSPLVIDDLYTNAYLETIGWDIPVAIMPMPLMGATAPASLISTLLVGEYRIPGHALPGAGSCAGNGRHLCAGAAEHRTVYLALYRWRSGKFIFGAATTEMGRYYGFPVEAATGGTDQYLPWSAVRATNAPSTGLCRPLAWPDILVGPGLLGGSTILCLEQMVMDVEIFRRCSRLYEGIHTDEDRWLEDAIQKAGPGGDFLKQKSTLKALRDGKFYLSEMGFHDTYEKWKNAGMPDIVDEIQEITRDILKDYQPLSLDCFLLIASWNGWSAMSENWRNRQVEGFMKFTGQFLSEVEQYRIHQESLHILAEVGVKFHGEKALPLLAKNGAKVDWDSKIAHIPKETGG